MCTCLAKFTGTATLLKSDSDNDFFFCEFCEIFKNIFFAGYLRVTASDIRMQVVVIYDLNLSFQFVSINFTFSLLRVFTLAHALMLLNFCVDFW